MDLDNFKREYASQLNGLTPARVSTLWKKSKTATRAELLVAIEHSMQAQIKDKQRRSKDSEPIITYEPTPTKDSATAADVVQTIDSVQAADSVQTIDSVQVVAADAVLQVTQPASRMSVADENDLPEIPDWSAACARSGVDHRQLRNSVTELLRMMKSRGVDIQKKHAELFKTVDDLMALRERRGQIIDVFAVLNV